MSFKKKGGFKKEIQWCFCGSSVYEVGRRDLFELYKEYSGTCTSTSVVC